MVVNPPRARWVAQEKCTWTHSILGDVLCGLLGNTLWSSGFNIQERGFLAELQPHPTMCLQNSPPTAERD